MPYICTMLRKVGMGVLGVVLAQVDTIGQVNLRPVLIEERIGVAPVY